jgi:hypothetical protein
VRHPWLVQLAGPGGHIGNISIAPPTTTRTAQAISHVISLSKVA